MSEVVAVPVARPLKPQPVALLVFLAIYVAWVGLLAWIYFTQAGAR